MAMKVWSIAQNATYEVQVTEVVRLEISTVFKPIKQLNIIKVLVHTNELHQIAKRIRS